VDLLAEQLARYTGRDDRGPPLHIDLCVDAKVRHR
jgi:hypothetical protein